MEEKKKPSRFINPYNFVSLGDEVVRHPYNEYEKGTLTGKINCKIEVKTPLAIPDTEQKKSEKIYIEKKGKKITHYNYPFYSINGKPVIPGSQIRGTIRSAYEVLSNGCFSVYNEDFETLSSRSSAIRKPGIIKYEKGRYVLYSAQMKKYKNIKEFNEYKPQELELKRTWYGTESEVEFESRINKEKEKGLKPNTNPKIIKKYYVIKAGKQVSCCNLEKAIKDYNINLEIYRKNSTDKTAKDVLNSDPYKPNFQKEVIPLKKASSSILYPVFYYETTDKDGEIYVYLLPSQAGRTVYKNRVSDHLGTHKSCSRGTNEMICEACFLFGTLAYKKAYASKIRFSDAYLSSEKFYSEKDVLLYELSSPKITSSEFYSRKPGDCKYWTYDYKITNYIGDENNLTEEIQSCDIELNGRKFYLHHPNISKNDYNDSSKTNRNCSMELAKPGNVFVFDVYFENITNEQLEKLVWTLTLGENQSNSKQQFMMGHGKPLGLGSVKIIVSNIEVRNFKRDTLSYSIDNLNPDELIAHNHFDTTQKYFKDFMLITNTDTAKGYTISYPVVDNVFATPTNKNANAIHQWFTDNRRGDTGTGTAWNIRNVLPPIDADDLSLPTYYPPKKNKT